jgi:hypothetical protein
VDFTRLATLAAGQHGCFTSRQLAEIDLSRHRLKRLGQQGLVVPTDYRTVYRLATTPVTWRQRVMAATLSMPGSMASHRTAAALRDLDGFEVTGRIEVITEHGTWRRRNVLVHQSKDLVAGDRDVVDGIPCTSLVRTLVDLPAVAWELRCGQALDHARRNDRHLFDRVLARHLEIARRGRNGTVMLRDLLERRGVGDQLTDTGFEARALHVITEACLPEPVPQYEVRDGTFRAFIDLAWPERMVGVECDSLAYHYGERAHQGDRTRRRHLTSLGWDIYEYTYQDVHRRPSTMVRELRKALDC